MIASPYNARVPCRFAIGRANSIRRSERTGPLPSLQTSTGGSPWSSAPRLASVRPAASGTVIFHPVIKSEQSADGLGRGPRQPLCFGAPNRSQLLEWPWAGARRISLFLTCIYLPQRAVWNLDTPAQEEEGVASRVKYRARGINLDAKPDVSLCRRSSEVMTFGSGRRSNKRRPPQAPPSDFVGPSYRRPE